MFLPLLFMLRNTNYTRGPPITGHFPGLYRQLRGSYRPVTGSLICWSGPIIIIYLLTKPTIMYYFPKSRLVIDDWSPGLYLLFFTTSPGQVIKLILTGPDPLDCRWFGAPAPFLRPFSFSRPRSSHARALFDTKEAKLPSVTNNELTSYFINRSSIISSRRLVIILRRLIT